MDNKKLLGNLILTVTAILWGMAFAFQKDGMDHIGPLSFAMSRLVLSLGAAAVMVAVKGAFLKKQGKHPRDVMTKEQYAIYRQNTIKGGIICGFFLSTASCLQQVAIVETSAGKAGFITALYVLLVPVIGTLFFGKSPSLNQWAAVAAGLVGLYLLCISGSFSLAKSDLLLIGCALLFSMQIINADKYVGSADPVAMSLVQFAAALVITSALAFSFEEPSLSQIRAAAVPIVYCGLISGGLGYTFQIIGQRYAEPVAASLILACESVFSVLGGWLLLGEVLTARELLGCCVMFAAIVLSQIPAKSAVK